MTLAKLHGAGNDFLVLVDPGASWSIGPGLARALCDRREGVGADGLLRALAPRHGGDLQMELWNADGSIAETSGNGLRCLALAAIAAGMVNGPRVRIETAAGLREVELRRSLPGGSLMAVEMGIVQVAEADTEPPLAGDRARRANVGNPHLVVLSPALAEISIEAVGRPIDRAEPGGINVEVIEPPTVDDALDLLVWERGAGVTSACGTGSCAVAAVARLWGLCGDRVTVRNPGGELVVELGGMDPLAPSAVLSGPTRHVADVTVDLAALGSPADERQGAVA